MATIHHGNLLRYVYQFRHLRRMAPCHVLDVARPVVLRFHLLVSDFPLEHIYLCGSFHCYNLRATPCGKSPVVVAGLLERRVSRLLHVSSLSFVPCEIVAPNAAICLVGVGVSNVHGHDLHLLRSPLRIDQFPRLVCVHSFPL